MRQLRRSITTKSNVVPNNQKPSLVDDETNLDLRHRCRRSYEVSQREARKSMYIRWIYDTSLARERYVTHHYVHRAIFRAFFGDESKLAAIVVPNFDLQHVEAIYESFPVNLNSTVMSTAIATVRPDEEMLDAKRQPSAGENHVLEDDDSDDAMSSLNSLDDSHSLGNDTALQLSWENCYHQERPEDEEDFPSLHAN